MKKLILIFILQISFFNLCFGDSDKLSGEALYSKLNSGWPKSLHEIKLKLNPNKSYFVISARNPLVHLDFRSPEKLRQSIWTNKQDDFEDIGHTMISWSCHLQNHKNIEGTAAQSGESQHQSKRMLKAGWGLSTLFATFTDGFLQDAEYVQSEFFDKHNEHNDFRIFTFIFETSDEDCAKTLDFIKQYTAEIAPQVYPGRFFGLKLHPENFEGGGCGSFANAALFLNQQWPSIAPLFWRELQIPTTLLGRLDQNSDDIQNIAPYMNRHVPVGQKISFVKLLQTNWDQKSEYTAKLNILDPELLFLFFKTLYTESLFERKKRTSEEIIFSEDWLSRYIYIYPKTDRISRQSKNFSRLKIDESLDLQTSNLIAKTQNWVHQKLKAYKFIHTQLQNQPVLIMKSIQ